MENLLPIGTVVSLTNGTKKVMITGYSSKDPNSDKVYDYNSCIFPEGIMEEKYCLFDKYQIEEIFYKGLESDEQKEFINKISSMTSSSHKPGMKKQSSKNTSSGGSYSRTPKDAKHPMSKEQMKEKYGITKDSNENLKEARKRG